MGVGRWVWRGFGGMGGVGKGEGAGDARAAATHSQGLGH